MNELKILEDGLVPVYTTDTGEKVVDSRELWAELKSKQDFSIWVKKRFEECDSVENADYISIHKKMGTSNVSKIEYIIKLSTAKEMANHTQIAGSLNLQDLYPLPQKNGGDKRLKLTQICVD